MARSTHPVIAGLTEEELHRDGCCAGANEARDFSGLSRTDLYRLMDDGVLPWWPKGEDANAVRMIPKRALAIILATMSRAAPPAVPRRQPCERQPA